MKKSKLLGMSLMAGALLFSGCGNANKNVVDENDDKPVFTSELEDEGGSLEYGAGYGFTEFNLEIDIDGVDTIDIDYKAKEQPKAEYVNKLNDFHLKDAEAMNAIHELFMDIHITKDSPKEEVTQEILEFLHIDHYSKFDLEIKFDNGDILDINDVK